jgi:hypothetical protein
MTSNGHIHWVTPNAEPLELGNRVLRWMQQENSGRPWSTVVTGWATQLNARAELNEAAS